MTSNANGQHERPVIYSTLVTLDGYVSGPNGELNWGLADEDMHRFINDRVMPMIDTSLFGRRMYEIMKFWDDAEDNPDLSEVERAFARSYNTHLKIVFSSTLTSVQRNARLADGDLEQEIARLREQPGKAIEVAGATLASHAFAQNLVDEVQLFVHPVIIGAGRPWFPNMEHGLELQLLETHRFESGVVYLRYQVKQVML